MRQCLFFILLISSGSLLAQEITRIDSTVFELTITGSNRRYFEDISGQLGIEEVSKNDSLFDQGASGHKDPDGVYWVKVRLLNTTPYDLDVVATGPRTINSTLYKREGDTFYSANFGSFVKKKDMNPTDSRVHVSFKLRSGVEEGIYFRGEGREFTASLQDARSYAESQSKAHFQDALFFGACFVLILYSLIQFAVYKKRAFIYLSIFAFGFAMYAFAIRGYFIDWFMPNTPMLGLNFTSPWVQIGLLGELLLTIDFLQLRRNYPLWHKVLLGLIVLCILRLFYGFYLTYVHLDYGTMTRMTLYTMLIDITVFKIMLLSIWKKVNASRKVFLVGLVLYGIAVIMGLLVWQFSIITNFRLALLYISSIAALSQILIFSVSLGIELRQHEVDKNVALDDLNTVLKEQNVKIEHEVVERTAQIENQKLQLEERNERIEVLFKEVHHRVKNNLQLISSLLNMQQEWSSTRDPIKAIEDSRSRVVAMSMIHQFLYRTDDISVINFKEYALELASKINDIQISPVEYELETTFEQDYDFDIDTSISLGLILNELITNSYKYAVNPGHKLQLQLTLKKVDNDYLELTYSDNGAEIEKTQEELVSEGFGLRMASRLSRQLKGSFSYTYKDRNEFKIIFATSQKRLELADA